MSYGAGYHQRERSRSRSRSADRRPGGNDKRYQGHDARYRDAKKTISNQGIRARLSNPLTAIAELRDLLSNYELDDVNIGHLCGTLVQLPHPVQTETKSFLPGLFNITEALIEKKTIDLTASVYLLLFLSRIYSTQTRSDSEVSELRDWLNLIMPRITSRVSEFSERTMSLFCEAYYRLGLDRSWLTNEQLGVLIAKPLRDIRQTVNFMSLLCKIGLRYEEWAEYVPAVFARYTELLRTTPPGQYPYLLFMLLEQLPMLMQTGYAPVLNPAFIDAYAGYLGATPLSDNFSLSKTRTVSLRWQALKVPCPLWWL